MGHKGIKIQRKKRTVLLPFQFFVGVMKEMSRIINDLNLSNSVYSSRDKLSNE